MTNGGWSVRPCATGGTSHLAAIAAELAQLLGWSGAERDDQIEQYRRLVDQHRFTPTLR